MIKFLLRRHIGQQKKLKKSFCLNLENRTVWGKKDVRKGPQVAKTKTTALGERRDGRISCGCLMYLLDNNNPVIFSVSLQLLFFHGVQNFITHNIYIYTFIQHKVHLDYRIEVLTLSLASKVIHKVHSGKELKDLLENIQVFFNEKNFIILLWFLY